MWQWWPSAGAWIVLGLLMPSLWGCEQSSSDLSPSSSSQAPHDGIGQRLGTDVTAQPGLAREPAREALPKIVAFGNSLTAGAGVPADESYPSQLQRRLDQSGYRYRVINAGVSGDTTAGGLRRVDWILKSRPQIVILELGGNDGLRGLPLDQMYDNLQTIIQRVHAAGAQVVLAGMKLPLNYGEEYRAAFEAVYARLAQAHQVTLMPFFLEGVGAQVTLNQADGIHPTGEGYRVIVEQLWPVLKPLLRNASQAASDESMVK
ncbi:MAG TPA: arylesterase [Nitrospiraceae bacterium]|nr:arylesterase [Nitrospiraceae bacterium]